MYPNSSWQNPEHLLTLFGSFWTELVQDVAQFQSIIASRGELNDQVDIEFQRLLSSTNSAKILPTRFSKCLPLTLDSAQAGNTDYDRLRYGQEAVYGVDHAYGETTLRPLTAYELPAGIRDIRVISNRLTEASMTLVAGLDFIIDGKFLLFVEDPAKNENVVDSDGLFTLWAQGVERDADDIFNQFGYVTGHKYRSSETYRRWITSYFRCLNNASAKRDILEFVAAALDVPIAKTTETVQDIVIGTDASWIVTDAATYRFGSSASPIVQIGDTVQAGDFLTDTVAIVEYQRGSSYSEINALALHLNFLDIPGWAGGEIIFENTNKATTVTTDQEYARLEFELKGHPGDVSAFWDNVHARGVAANETLAMLLDTRTNKEGQPTAMNLPATINPVKFLFDNFFRRCLAVVRVKISGQGPESLGASALQLLHQLTPPHCCYLVLTEYSGEDAAVTLTPAEDSAEFVPLVLGQDPAGSTSFGVESGFVTTLNGRCV